MRMVTLPAPGMFIDFTAGSAYLELSSRMADVLEAGLSSHLARGKCTMDYMISGIFSSTSRASFCSGLVLERLVRMSSA